jgi:hypothetical protein
MKLKLKRKSAILGAALGLLLWLVPAVGWADGGVPDGGVEPDAGEPDDPLAYPDEVRSPIRFEYLDALIEDVCGFDFDTGWQPTCPDPDLCVQVRFRFRIGCGYYMEMNGYAVLDWPPRPGPMLSFKGITRGGRYELDYSLLVSGRVKLHIDQGGILIDEEFDIPWIPDFNIGVYANRRFNPFLLEGNPERPLEIVDQIPHTLLLSVDVIELMALLGIIPPQDLLHVWLDIYFDGYVGSRFEGRRIVVDTGEQNTEFPIPDLIFTVEGQKERLPLSPEEQRFGMRQAIYEGAVTHFSGFSFYPHIRVEVAGIQIIDVGLFEIPIDIDDAEDYWIFEPVNFEFSLPDIAAPETVFVPPTNIGTDSVVHVNIKNIGGRLLRGEGLVDPPFYVPYPNRFEIEPDGDVYLPVYFTPSSVGPVRKYLALYSNDPNESPLLVAVESHGCAPDGDCAIPEDMIRVCEGSGGGCGCRFHRNAQPHALVVLLLLALAAWGISRRRRG